ncbi:MAG: protease modulator HflC [Deltaproteobacteria bacterium]|nr:protease modulator HflC [Deltaproteobacteria bacterium]
MKKATIIIISVIVIIIGLNLCLFVVHQTEYALLIQLGKPVKEVLKPGLYFKIPFIQNVAYFDNRILLVDAAPAEVLTKDKKNLVIDNFFKWRITSPLRLYRSLKNEAGAAARLDDIVYSELRVDMGIHTMTEIVTKYRGQIMKTVTKKSNEKVKPYGVEIIDVRIKRADLPEQNEKFVYGRMKAEREREAKKYRSEGREAALRITAEADRDKAIILAEAYRKAQTIKGEGDSKATKIYAEAYQKDPEFFEFVRSIEAYRKCLKKKTTLILSPRSEFFRYLQKVE